MISAAIALGIEGRRRSDRAIASEVSIRTPKGLTKAWALLDMGAENNFIDQTWAKTHLPDTQISIRRVHALDGHHITSYGERKLSVLATDSHDITREGKHFFETVDIKGYDLVLGFPWLHDEDPDINWHERTWRYRNPSKPLSPNRLLSPKRFLKKAKKNNLVFVAVLREISPLSVEELPSGTTLAAGIQGSSSDENPLHPLVDEFSDVFAEDGSNQILNPSDHSHAIDIVPGKVPPYKPIYNLSEEQLRVLKDYLDEAQRKGWIRPSQSEAGAPIFFVPKKDGGLRLCVDYRGLNAITAKNRYPLPLISETLDRLAGANLFTKLDLRDAYHRIKIRVGDEWKTAFRTRYGHFEYQVMPFGLANAPATFQAYINRALSSLLDVCCVVYLDDILIYSRNLEEHRAHVAMVLNRLRKYKLFAKLSKCEFATDTVSFLGYVISPKGISMEQSRIETIESWPEPQSVHDIQVFLGFSNFYRKFIEGYSRISAPLSNLLRGRNNSGPRIKNLRLRNKSPNTRTKTTPFKLTSEAREAFYKLKEKFTEAPLLRHFNPGLPIRIDPDASQYAIAAIICQLQPDDNQWHPIAYWSRKLTAAEAHYHTYDAELLAIVAAFRQWRHYLEGSTHPITVLSDHANLQFFMTTKELNRRQARWAEELSAYDFIIKHRPGKNNPADAPSRRPDYERELEKHTLLPTLQNKLRNGILTSNFDMLSPWLRNQLQKLLEQSNSHLASPSRRRSEDPSDESRAVGDTGEPELLVPRSLVAFAAATETAYSDMPEPLADLLRTLQRGDAHASKVISELLAGGMEAEQSSPWHLTQDSLLRYKGCVFVPKDTAVRAEILRTHHDDPQGGHFGIKRTLDTIQRKYYWQGLPSDVKNHVKTCQVCQENRTPRHKPYGMLERVAQPTRPFETISLDFITGLPPSRWRNKVYNAILVVVDLYTKFCFYIPCTKDIDAQDLAELIFARVVAFVGMPQNLVSDRGSLFTSKFWSTLCYYLGAKRRLSTAFHPQTDGQTERMNQILEHYLRCYVNFEQDDWARWLPLAQFTYNNSKHSSTGMSPSELLMGARFDLNIDIQAPEPEGFAPDALDRAKALKNIRENLQEHLKAAFETQKRYYDQKHKPMTFKIGDKVMLRTKNFTLARPCRKLAERQIGPLTIVDAWGKQAYKLDLPPRFRDIHPVFHVSLLEPWHSRPGEEDPRPDPILIQGENEWIVESILAMRKRHKKTQYLVKWQGYPDTETSWEPAEFVEDTIALEEFESRQKAKERVNRPGRKRGR